MFENASDFWNKELKDINMDGLDSVPRRLSPICRKIIRERCEALRGREKCEGICVSGHIDIKADIIDFSRSLGATKEEIESDILPSLGL